MDAILVLNAGSSSLKFQLFGIGGPDGPQALVKGKIDGIGTHPHLRATGPAKTLLVDRDCAPSEVPDLPAATHAMAGWMRETQQVNLVAVGHRVVHGGPDYSQPVRLDEQVLQYLERFIPLAPLHQPHNLEPIRTMIERRPELPQVACFDTAFHRGHSAVADHYAIPERFHAEGVRRYGFHGLSYEYISGRLREVAPDVAGGRIVVAHLGSGASLCALSDGRSIESTLGFTALDGLPMGTRCGQIDPGVILYLIDQKGMTAKEVQDLLYKESGLKGLSGVSNDVRDLLESDDPRAAFALDHFVYRVGLHAGAMAAALDGLDAFVFTAGIGENSPEIRAAIAKRLEWCGAELDPAANAAGKSVISTERSRVRLLVVPTDEELMIVRHTLALL
ncbi:MAG: acetate kinase [Mesorhizobium sp. SCN 65-20]|nr:MAG: acetate kinase [Mesorhizobium sp. SCN 65-20]